MSGIKDRLVHRKKQLNCPSCKALLRVPIKSGKRMLVTCPHCLDQFELRFSNPLKETFQWNKTLPFKRNIEELIQRFSAQPLKSRVLMLVVIFSATFFIVTLFRLLTMPQSASKPQSSQQQQFDNDRAEKRGENNYIDNQEKMEL